MGVRERLPSAQGLDPESVRRAPPPTTAATTAATTTATTTTTTTTTRFRRNRLPAQSARRPAPTPRLDRTRRRTRLSVL